MLGRKIGHDRLLDHESVTFNEIEASCVAAKSRENRVMIGAKNGRCREAECEKAMKSAYQGRAGQDAAEIS